MIPLLCLVLGLFPALGSSPSAIFESRYHAASALQVVFLERYLENGNPVRTESGIAYFRRPGRMRWEYQAPENNLFLVDGKWAWFYVPADHTVTRVRAQQSSDWRTPIALLADNPKLSRVCSRVASAATVRPDTAGNAVLFCLVRGAKLDSAKQRVTAATAPEEASAGSLSLESRASAQGVAIFLEIDPKTGVLARVLVTEPGAVSIEFKFTNWKFDPPIPDSSFRFQPPPGVAIVDGELPQRENRVSP